MKINAQTCIQCAIMLYLCARKLRKECNLLEMSVG